MTTRTYIKTIVLQLLCVLTMSTSFSKSKAKHFYFIDNEIKNSYLIKNQMIMNSTTFQLFSHGKSGELLIDGEWKNAIQIAEFLKNTLPANTKHINIYGCEFAKGVKGTEAVKYLQKELQISVSASSNITGTDGDWKMEVGNNTNVLNLPNYKGNLQCGGTVGGTASTDDYDGDGVCNEADLDDDNDGILDAIESPSCFYTTTEANVIIGVTTGLTISTGSTPLLYNDVLTTATPNFSFTAAQQLAGSTIFTVQYPTPIKLTSMTIVNITSLGTSSTGSLFGSNDGIAWTDLMTGTISLATTVNKVLTVNQNAGEYKYYKIQGEATATTLANGIFEITSIQNTTNYIQSAHPKASCTGSDLDNDGIANYLDLDSDADGCSDAAEGSSSITSGFANSSMPGGSTGVTQNLGNTVGNTTTTMGVPTVVGSGQATGVSQINAINMCLDSDGDGVVDINDLDDDNDGILDSTECSNITYYEFLTTGLVSNVFPLNNLGFENTTLAQWPSGISTNPSSATVGFYQWYHDGGTVAPDYTVDVDVPGPTGTGAHLMENVAISPNGGRAVWSSSASILSEATRQRVDGLTVGQTYNLPLSYTSDGSYAASTSMGILFRVYDVNGTTLLNQQTVTSPVSIAATTSQWLTTTFSWTATQSNVIIRISGLESDSAQGVIFDGAGKVISICTSDTDADGIVNSLDLDSDGDGCSDASEGGALFTTGFVNSSLLSGNNVNPSGQPSYNGVVSYGIISNLGNTVGNTATTLGVPTVAGTGQSVGTSLMVASKSVYCTTHCGGTVGGTGLYDDYDGDSICNGDDLDIDNDGILNAVESPSCFYTTTEANTITGVTTGLTISAGTTSLLYNGVLTTATPNFTFTASQQLAGSNIFTIQYPTPINLTSITIVNTTSLGTSSTGSLFGSNDGINWTDLMTGTTSLATTANKVLTVNQNAGEYKYYKIQGEATATTLANGIFEITSIQNTTNYNLSAHPKITCTGSDTDADGIFNHFDLDSDNDGCSDAFESGVTVVSGVTMITNNTVVAGTYGVNGFADSLETSSESGVYKGTYTYSNAINNTIHTCGCPTISGTVTNITTCGNTDGTIKICGLIPLKGNHTVSYIKDGGTPTTLTNQVCDATGCITITGLGVGNYTNISVVTLSCAGTTPISLTIGSNQSTTAGTISTDQTICKDGTPADIVLTGNTGSVVKWQKSTDLAFTTPIDISNTSTTLTSVDMGSVSATTYYRAVVQNGSCTAAYSNVVTVTIISSTWDGSTWSNGIPTIEISAIFTGNYSSSSDLFACSVTVTNGASVTINTGNDYTVYGKVTVDTGSTFTFNNDANLIQISNIQNSGNIIVKRNAPPLSRLDYKIWSSPVSSQQLQAFSPATLSNRFYTYDSSISNYSLVSPTNNFDLGKGYLIRMPNTFPTYPVTSTFTGIYTGVPNNGDIIVPISNSGDLYSSIGNLYPSTISAFDFVYNNIDNITGTLYFWRKSNNTNYLPGYCTWAGGTFTGNGELQTFSGGLDYLQVGQGFIVKSKNNSSSVIFNNSIRTGNNGGVTFRNSSAIEYNRIWLNLTSTTTTEFNQMAVGYITGATLGVDIFDGFNINTTNSILLCSLINGENYTIQGLPLPFVDTNVVPLSCKITTPGNYTITIAQVDGLFTGGAQDIFIKDNLNGTYNNLNTSPYTFASDAGVFTNRFEIVYRDGSLSTNTVAFNSNQVVVYKNNDNIVINSGKVEMSKVKIFDIRGRLLAEKSNINATETKMNVGSTNEVLLVQITSVDGAIVTKKIIN